MIKELNLSFPALEKKNINLGKKKKTTIVYVFKFYLSP